jgi:hypothetical protein
MTSEETARAALARSRGPWATPAARALAERVQACELAALARSAPLTPAAPHVPARAVPPPYRPRMLARVLMAAAPHALRAG